MSGESGGSSGRRTLSRGEKRAEDFMKGQFTWVIVVFCVFLISSSLTTAGEVKKGNG
jgi:hypothetical protein